MDVRDVVMGLAVPREAKALAVMSRDLIEAGLGWSYRPERIASLIVDPEAVVLVARHAGAPVGFAVMSLQEERAHLVLLAVAAAWRRIGVGRRLLTWLLESAATAGVVSVHVELRADNQPAFHLYRSLGFTETFRVPGYYRGREEAMRMIRVFRVPRVESTGSASQ